MVQATPTDPSSNSTVLIQGVDATTSGYGFEPTKMARTYLLSMPIFLGEALVKADVGLLVQANPAAKAKTKAAFALNRRVEIYGQK